MAIGNNLNIIAKLKLSLPNEELQLNLSAIRKQIEGKLNIGVTLSIKGIEEYKKKIKEATDSSGSSDKNSSANKKQISEIQELISRYKSAQISAKAFMDEANQRNKSSEFANADLKDRIKLLSSLKSAEKEYANVTKETLKIRNALQSGSTQTTSSSKNTVTPPSSSFIGAMPSQELVNMGKMHTQALAMNSRFDTARNNQNIANMNRQHTEANRMNNALDRARQTRQRQEQSYEQFWQRSLQTREQREIQVAQRTAQSYERFWQTALRNREQAEQRLSARQSEIEATRISRLNANNTPSSPVKFYDQLKQQEVQTSALGRAQGLESRIATVGRSSFTDPAQLRAVNAEYARLEGSIGRITNNRMAQQWTTDYTALNNQVRLMNQNIEAGGRSLAGYFQNLGNTISKFSQWMVVATLVMQPLRQMQEAVQYIYNMNTAITDLNKVTNFTTSQLNSMKESAISMGKELGKSSVDIMNSFAEFGRVAKDMESIQQLSKTAVLTSNVTSMSAGEAAKAINTTMIAFKMDAKDSVKILDQWNELKFLQKWLCA